MKILTAIILPFLIVSCELSSNVVTEEPKPKVEAPFEPEPPIEEPVEEIVEEGMELADPNTTGKFLTEENKKTVAGPVPVKVKVPEPEEDSVIDIKPSLPSVPLEQ